MTIVKWSMLLVPVAVFGLMAKFTARAGIDALTGIGVYVGTVLLGLLIILCIYLIIGVDRILDMSRTAINVKGDLVACKVMDRWVRGKKSAEKEVAEEMERELRHIQTGEDVVLDTNNNQ